MRSLKVSDCEVFFEQKAGSVPVSMLFLHGSGGTHQVWRNQMDLGFNIVAADLPGHGCSCQYPCESIAEASLLTAQLLEKLHLQGPVFLLGHSMGAAITLYTALSYPAMIDGIILAGGGARLRVLPDVLKSLAQGEIDPNFLRIAFAPAAPAQLVEAELSSYLSCSISTLYSDLTCCDQFDISRQLDNIHIPALIIVGKEDRLTPVKYAEYLAVRLPRAELAVVENAGHYVMLEQPQQVNTLITNFVSRFLK